MPLLKIDSRINICSGFGVHLDLTGSQPLVVLLLLLFSLVVLLLLLPPPPILVLIEEEEEEDDGGVLVLLLGVWGCVGLLSSMKMKKGGE